MFITGRRKTELGAAANDEPGGRRKRLPTASGLMARNGHDNTPAATGAPFAQW
ncbi:hypothetical protein ACIBO2_54065 [Nonomuraea sp. NPDC050022]|uniref:hypothetical protein n=1 Tax=unclassified Nonomuraea TaxID=2593643 RepID=UPI0033C28CCB